MTMKFEIHMDFLIPGSISEYQNISPALLSQHRYFYDRSKGKNNLLYLTNASANQDRSLSLQYLTVCVMKISHMYRWILFNSKSVVG